MKQAERTTFAALALFAAVVVTVQGAARVGRHPMKLPTAAVSLNLGDLVVVSGTSYQVQLVPGLVPFTTPIPTPTPAPKPTLTGIRDRLTGLLVTSAAAGTPLTIEGAGLGTAAGRVQLAGRIAAAPSAWTDTAIQFLAPDPGAVAVTGGWDVYQPSGSTFTIIASSGSFTLLPASTPGPTPTPDPLPLPQAMSLTVTGFKDAMGVGTDTFAPGSTVFIEGQGFGTAGGKVQIGVNDVPVRLWTPTEIQVTCPALDIGGQTAPVLLTVTSAAGKEWHRLKAFAISGPAPASPPPGARAKKQ